MVDQPESLKEYREKRDFTKTSEPQPGTSPAAPALAPHQGRYVVHKHDATRLHYDVRLEVDGVLVSWAVPQGPSYDPTVKRLAVKTEDHPMEYLDYEAVIPKGEYGAGPIIMWDQGVYTNIRGTKRKPFSMREALADGLVEVRFDGEKLKGEFAFVQTKYDGSKDNWLMVKMKDKEVDPEYDIVNALPLSVKTGKSIEEVYEEATRAQLPPALHRLQPETLDKLIEAKFPGWQEPMLASPEDKPFNRPNWIYEPKLDGERAIIFRKSNQVQMLSRNKLIITDQYPDLIPALQKLGTADFVADGEIVAFENGRTSFERIQQRMHVQKPSKQLLEEVPAFVYLFDVTYYGGYDTTKLTQIERKELLRGLVKYEDPLRYLEYREGDGVAYFNEICAKGEEGIIAKDGNALYQRSRSKSWLKFKCVRQQELVIGGYTDPGSGMRGFGSLLVGYYPPGSEKMQFAGGVGTGFSDELIRDIKKKLDEHASDENPFFPDEMLPTSEVHWVKPELVAQVGFGEWTKTNKVRHPRFLGLRRDKDARQVTREEHAAPAEPDNAAAAAPVRAGVNAKESSRTVEGHKIKITNPDKMLFPDVSKLQVIDYYEYIAPFMLPHTHNRPISMQRFPDGIKAQGFFHKEAPEYFPDFVDLVEVYTNETDTQKQVMVNNAATLVYLAQLASFVIHTWTSQAPKLEVPDKIIFDLDPSTDDSWDAVKEGAHDLRAMLKDMGLPSFVMATGSRGLHVCMPLVPEHKFDTVNLFAKAVCTTMERRDKKFTTELRKDKRKGRIFLDWLRNQYAQTGVAPYSLRPKPGAPIAAPLDWEELKDPTLYSNSFTVRSIAERLNGRDDPWKEFFNFRTPLPDFTKIEEVLKS